MRNDDNLINLEAEVVEATLGVNTVLKGDRSIADELGIFKSDIDEGIC
jgi:hypothetical protein